MKKKRVLGILLSLALMLTMMPAMSLTALAAVNPPAVYVITSENFSTYFDDEGYLKDDVEEGSVLDFKGTFSENDYSLYINKKVDITSSTDDALFISNKSDCLKFNIVAGADHTTVRNLKFMNSDLFINNVSNITVDNISMTANITGIGSGTGFLSIHTTENTVVKNSSFENAGNGGSPILDLGKGTKNSVVENNTFKITGMSGNALYETTYNIGTGDTPEYNTYKNNTFIAEIQSSAICWLLVICGSNDVIEGNNFKYSGNAIAEQYGNTATNNTYKNNTVTGGGTIVISANSTAEGNITDGSMSVKASDKVINNTVGKMTITGAEAQISDNTVTGDVSINRTAANTQFTGNRVDGQMIVNAKGCKILGNKIDSPEEEYAVLLKSTEEDSNSDVEYNILTAAEKKGNDAVDRGTGGGNIVANNSGDSIDLQDAWIQDIDDVTYTGDAIEPEVVVNNGVVTLRAGTDYTVGYTDNINAGTASVTITAVSDSVYGGTASATFTIQKVDPKADAPTGLNAIYGQTLADVALSNPDGNTEGTWSWVDPATSVGDLGINTFKANFTPDDAVNYNNKENVDVNVTVVENPQKEADDAVAAAQEAKKKSDNAAEDASAALAEAAEAAKTPGSSAVAAAERAKALADIAKEAAEAYKEAADKADKAADQAVAQAATDEEITAAKAAKEKSVTLVSDAGVAVANAKKAAEEASAAVTSAKEAKAKAEQEARKAQDEADAKKALIASNNGILDPTLPRVKISKPKAAKKSLTAKWKKLKKKQLKVVKGIEVEYSLTKDFQNPVFKTTSKKKANVKINKLQSRKTYYVRAHTYVIRNGRKYVSIWSSVKKVKTK